MFNNFFGKNEKVKSFENQRREAMKLAVDKVCENAVSEKEYDEFMSLALRDSLSEEEENRCEDLEEKVERATLKVEGINDFKYAMDYFGVEDTIDTLAHENAHANKAEQLDVNFQNYYMRIMRAENGHFIADIGATIDTDLDSNYQENHWSNIKKKEADILITKAPNEYGNKMSDGDIERLKNIEDWY